MTSPQRGPVGVGVPSSTWGRGWTDLVTVNKPSAGTPALRTVPSLASEAILTACATYTLSAAAANRYPALSFVNGDGTVWATFAASTALVASAVGTVTWALGTSNPGGAGGSAPVIPIPDFILSPGWGISIGGLALDVADQISGIVLSVLHIPTGPTGPPAGTATLDSTSGLYLSGAQTGTSQSG